MDNNDFDLSGRLRAELGDTRLGNQHTRGFGFIERFNSQVVQNTNPTAQPRGFACLRGLGKKPLLPKVPSPNALGKKRAYEIGCLKAWPKTTTFGTTLEGSSAKVPGMSEVGEELGPCGWSKARLVEMTPGLPTNAPGDTRVDDPVEADSDPAPDINSEIISVADSSDSYISSSASSSDGDTDTISVAYSYSYAYGYECAFSDGGCPDDTSGTDTSRTDTSRTGTSPGMWSEVANYYSSITTTSMAKWARYANLDRVQATSSDYMAEFARHRRALMLRDLWINVLRRVGIYIDNSQFHYPYGVLDEEDEYDGYTEDEDVDTDDDTASDTDLTIWGEEWDPLPPEYRPALAPRIPLTSC